MVIPLLSSTNASVQFEAAGALLGLSQAPAAVRAATSSYITLLCTHSDNNVKLIVLDRLVLVKNQHPKIMQELLMDVLRALSAYVFSSSSSSSSSSFNFSSIYIYVICHFLFLVVVGGLMHIYSKMP